MHIRQLVSPEDITTILNDLRVSLIVNLSKGGPIFATVEVDFDPFDGEGGTIRGGKVSFLSGTFSELAMDELLTQKIEEKFLADTKPVT